MTPEQRQNAIDFIFSDAPEEIKQELGVKPIRFVTQEGRSPIMPLHNKDKKSVRGGTVGYNTGTPIHTGVYACRVPEDRPFDDLCKDLFLMWMEGSWSYLGSDQRYRGPIIGWLGPLERRHH